ncbi:MAG: hypothetical protein JXR68_05340 [Bacteroidales bacterium]|nr:hypothetical protein [Bacteroidales bacterium]
MKDRIQKYMDYKSISAGELAGILNVQRSNISHILNGRNKPGAAFIEKFLISFPDLNARWLLTGQGDMIVKDNNPTNQTDTFEAEIKVKEPKPINAINNMIQDDKPVTKIVFFYNDGTFDDYNKRE